MQKKYIATIEMFVHADNDEQAIIEIEALTSSLRNQLDNEASVASLVARDGSHSGREVIPNSKRLI